MNRSISIIQRQILLLFITSLLLFVGQSLGQTPGQSASDPKLEHAITVLRHIQMAKFNEEQQKTKSKEIDGAWDVITKAGPTGIARLKDEVRRVDASQEKDDYFKLNATSLLWKIGKLDEVETIAAIWRTTPLNAQSKYVFYTAFEAATTQDPRALPLLLVCLRDNKVGVSLANNGTDVMWPFTEVLLWGAYGPVGLPARRQVLATSNDEVTLQSAILVLTLSQDVAALPRIRELAATAKGGVRESALRSLGTFGHPQDFDFLVATLGSNEEWTVQAAAYALFEYEDQRAVPYLIPLLKSQNRKIRREALMGLVHLLTPTSVATIQEHCADAERNTPLGSYEQDECRTAREQLQELKIDLDDYAKKTDAQKAGFLAAKLDDSESEFKTRPDDRKLTREQLQQVLDGWKKTHRAFDKGMTFQELPKKDGKDNAFVVSMSQYGWVEMRHVLAVGTAEDIPSLLAVTASVYSRLTRECFGEAAQLEFVVRRLGRSRYRKVVGITAKSE